MNGAEIVCVLLPSAAGVASSCLSRRVAVAAGALVAQPCQGGRAELPQLVPQVCAVSGADPGKSAPPLACVAVVPRIFQEAFTLPRARAELSVPSSVSACMHHMNRRGQAACSYWAGTRGHTTHHVTRFAAWHPEAKHSHGLADRACRKHKCSLTAQRPQRCL